VDRERAVDVQAVPPEEVMRLHPEGDQEVTGCSPARPSLALPRESQLGPGIHPRRHRHDDLPLLADLAAATADPARLARHLPAAIARGTRPLHCKAALAERDRARAPAFAARLRPRARRVPGAAARGALLGDGHADRQPPATRRHRERNLDDVLDVAPALRRAPPPAPRTLAEVEDRAEQIAQATEVQVLGRRTEPAARAPRVRARPAEPEPGERPHLAELIVLLPLLRVGEDRIRLPDLLEALRRTRVVPVRVRMVLLGELAIRPLDLLGRSALRHAQDLIVILARRRWHRRPNLAS